MQHHVQSVSSCHGLSSLAGVFAMVHGDRAGPGRFIAWVAGRSTGEEQDM